MAFSEMSYWTPDEVLFVVFGAADQRSKTVTQFKTQGSAKADSQSSYQKTAF